MAWTAENEKYLEKNWDVKTCREIGQLLGKHTSSVWSKAKRLGFLSKTIVKDISRAVNLEIQGREKMKKTKDLVFKKGQKIKAKIRKARGIGRVKGIVVFENDYIVTIDNGKYMETLNKADLITGDAILEKIN